MLRSLYLSATNMLTQRNKVDVITNNLSNLSTTGYRSDRLVSRSFDDMLIARLDDPALVNKSTTLGPLNTGVYVDMLVTSFEQGSFEDTGALTDIAINGENAFFVVDTPAGQRYTRDGSFRVDVNGYLVTTSGHRVLGEGGAGLLVGNASFKADGLGNLTTEDGQSVGKLRLVSFSDLNALRKAGDNLLFNYGNAAVTDAESYGLLQGRLETANTNVTSEVVELMRTSRAFETSQRIVKMLDESLGKSVNEIGKV